MVPGFCSRLAEGAHEQCLLSAEPGAGYFGIIAIHDTTLGPALGGTRLWRYGSTDDALHDALRLARGMTYKAALAGLRFGGGKSVIMAPPAGSCREALFLAHGRAVATLRGRYITAEDVGTMPADMAVVRRVTRWVTGLPDRTGDPGPITALGVFAGIRAALRHAHGTESLSDVRVAVQGLGNVGRWLCRYLADAGARLVVSDVDRHRVVSMVEAHGAEAVSPDEILATAVDVLSPCALGAVLDDRTIPRLRAGIVAGGANNQLAEDRHADVLQDRGVLYVPDFVINAGGLMTGAAELAGWTRERAQAQAEGIFDTTMAVLTQAATDGTTPQRAAVALAEARIRAHSSRGK